MWFLSGKEVVFRLNWLYLVKSGCIRAKVVVFRQGGCILAKEIIFLQSGCIQAKWLYLGKIGLKSNKSDFIRTKVFVFG